MIERAGRTVVVGAALGPGRWFADHLAGPALLVDTTTAAAALLDRDDGDTRVGTFADDGRLVGVADGKPLTADGISLAIVAVPPGALEVVVRDLAAQLPPDAQVVVVTSTMRSTLEQVRAAAGGRRVHGAHLLFDPGLTPAEGQGVHLVPDGEVPVPVAELVARAGGVLRTGTAEEHDAAMAVVQAATHRTLVAFADAVTRAEPDLETLWALRTPLFDSLLGLTTRALDPRQQVQVAAVQAESGALAGERLSAALADMAGADFEEVVVRTRGRITGALFEELSTSARAGIQAAQERRRAIARRWQDGRVVGLRRSGTDGPVRVGRIAAVTPTRVELEVLLVGAAGRAALLHGPGVANAARLGVPTAVHRQRFGAGHVELVPEAELARVLDDQLAFLPRDVRFLVPESVAGSGVARVVAQHEGLRDVRLVDEVVRTGQRSVVVHLAVRADRDVDATVEAVRREVEAAYAWPVGVTRALDRRESEVVYLGPAGTFSEVAAHHAAEAIGIAAPLVALPSFGDVLAAVRPGTVGVLPVSSSASGLVGRAVDALLAADRALVASGVVDVAVRFDAYALGPAPLEQHRGAAVYSHPQGLAQCSRFIARWGLVPVPTASTAEALALVGRTAEPAIALGGVGLGGALRVIEREVDDLSGSITRFLVLGADGEFAPQRDGSDPTLRTIRVGRDVGAVPDLLPRGGAAFTELLTDADGRFLLITSAPGAEDRPGVRSLGTLPWSPRTPVVRAAAD